MITEKSYIGEGLSVPYYHSALPDECEYTRAQECVRSMQTWEHAGSRAREREGQLTWDLRTKVQCVGSFTAAGLMQEKQLKKEAVERQLRKSRADEKMREEKREKGREGYKKN